MIIIPSKNIYKIENSVIIDNLAEKIEVSTENITKQNNYYISVQTDTIETSDLGVNLNGTNLLHITNSNYDSHFLTYKPTRFTTQDNYYYIAGAFAGVIPTYKTLRIEIPKRTASRFITQLYSGVDTDGIPHIKTTVKYKVAETSNCNVILSPTSSADWSNPTKESEERFILSQIVPNGLTIPDRDIQYSNFILDSETITNFIDAYSYDNSPEGYGYTLESEVEISNNQNIRTAYFNYDEISEKYTIDLTILCGLVSFKGTIGVASQDDDGSIGLEVIPTTVTGNSDKTNLIFEKSKFNKCSVTQYYPFNVEISFYGNTISLNLSDKIISVGSSDAHIISIPSNHFMQSSNYNATVPSNLAIIDDFSKVVEEYKNGKRTLTLLCAIDDYYDENGDLKISKSVHLADTPMTFSIYDEVLPLIMNVNGEDEPMFYSQSGEAITFSTLGAKVLYDGAVWQEISIQEI